LTFQPDQATSTISQRRRRMLSNVARSFSEMARRHCVVDTRHVGSQISPLDEAMDLVPSIWLIRLSPTSLTRHARRERRTVQSSMPGDSRQFERDRSKTCLNIGSTARSFSRPAASFERMTSASDATDTARASVSCSHVASRFKSS
jgi:hypothetical protein